MMSLAAESKSLISALEERDVEYESWLIKSAGYDVTELADRVELIARMEAFTKKHL